MKVVALGTIYSTRGGGRGFVFIQCDRIGVCQFYTCPNSDMGRFNLQTEFRIPLDIIGYH